MEKRLGNPGALAISNLFTRKDSAGGPEKNDFLPHTHTSGEVIIEGCGRLPRESPSFPSHLAAALSLGTCVSSGLGAPHTARASCTLGEPRPGRGDGWSHTVSSAFAMNDRRPRRNKKLLSKRCLCLPDLFMCLFIYYLHSVYLLERIWEVLQY